MTNTPNTSLNDLIALKLAVINHHKGDSNEYLRSSIARDACYTSFNSRQWKLDQMSDIRAELSELTSGSEVIDVKIERKLDLYESMEHELAELDERHAADLAVFKEITGETWTRKPKRTHKSDGLGTDDRLARILKRA